MQNLRKSGYSLEQLTKYRGFEIASNSEKKLTSPAIIAKMRLLETLCKTQLLKKGLITESIQPSPLKKSILLISVYISNSLVLKRKGIEKCQNSNVKLKLTHLLKKYGM